MSENGTEELANPMRFSIADTTLHLDLFDVDPTEIDIRPSEGNLYVHWEDNEPESANGRLWSVIEELQELRNHEDTDSTKERRIKSAVSELDQVRMAVKQEADCDD